MCSECDELRRKIAVNRGLSIGLENQLDVLFGEHLEAARPSSQKALDKKPMVQ